METCDFGRVVFCMGAGIIVVGDERVERCTSTRLSCLFSFAIQRETSWRMEGVCPLFSCPGGESWFYAELRS